MIISHRHRFVFVKTTKTAGTSVEIALSKHCGPDDVITPIHPDDEVIRQEKGYPGPQNHVTALPDGRPWALNNHSPAVRARRLLGQQVWRDYFTFAFERNPFDRTVSAYHYMKKNRVAKGIWKDSLTFDAFVRKPGVLDRIHQRGWGLYAINDRVIVDHIYRFEDLNGGMADIYARLGIDESEPLMQTKVSKREASYREYYDAATRALVAKAFEKELETFGYAF
ncbi:MAG: sulfotransferase family 2 domain-containing protein [Antarcticimicrobium sp.]|uniref:sulfotransferase family 2 domain-containing protein n=1 Tax=Antarcticimicrobium sp. TaxID=2824147 RepID=UPI0026106696|nr:sulfotransferase family 2 domain-containing protein [Antarcticimicrobium sp.]MDF1716023.1 sulfotransferase family 2 domain-containing protein [Antarcticimicrobium sp.]